MDSQLVLGELRRQSRRGFHDQPRFHGQRRLLHGQPRLQGRWLFWQQGLASILAVAILAVPNLYRLPTATAAAITDFDPGFIISDVVMYNYNSMSQAQISQFIATVGAQCVPTPGNTCLKDYRQDTITKPATSYCPGVFQGATGDTAAAIIYKAAQACKINPQVLLVTMQKEQSLVAKITGRPAEAYQKALGFGCPDSTPGVCNSTYAGFANQVYAAASRLQQYAAEPYRFNHQVGKPNKILFHPNEALCGSSQVTIKTQATASLYNYTPYQPNTAALAAGSGLGNACSTYGNRNFHLYFNQWFGNPKAGGAVAYNPINRPPVGVLDAVTTSNTQITVSGWVFDIDTANAITVQVMVGGNLATTSKANLSRPDVQNTYNLANANHGFTINLTDQPVGLQEVCVWAVNEPTGGNVNIGCKPVLVVDNPDFTGQQVTRLAGVSREATAREVAKALFAAPDTVFIATGGTYPDALAAAAAAQQANAPLLLYGSDVENTQTLAYLDGLAGLKKIYVFGGQAAIPNLFTDALKQIAPVARIAGADRYATAAKIATKFFPNATTAFVATGLNFPDALAAAAAAGSIGAPVLLVGADVASAAQAQSYLNSANIDHIYIAGGSVVISEKVEKALQKHGKVERFAGADRYHTAAAIAGYFFPSASTGFIATGLNFPDALAGAAAGAQTGSPVLLTNPYQLGEHPKAYLNTSNKNVNTIYLLGGESALFPGT